MIHKILVAVDASPAAAEAVRVGGALAEQTNAALGLLHVVDAISLAPDMGITYETLLDDLRMGADQLLRTSGASLSSALAIERFVEEGIPDERIVAKARAWGADLIVMGTDSRGRLAHFLLGSTADAVIRSAPCPVMTVRQSPEQRPSLPPTTEHHAEFAT